MSKLRWVLPVGNALVDVVLLVMLIAYAGRAGKTSLPAEFRNVILQDEGSVEWVPMHDLLPGPFELVVTGNGPAGLISTLARPQAGMAPRRGRWDPVWFFLHESIAFAVWWSIGAWADRRGLWLGRLCLAYLAVRVLALWPWGAAGKGTGLQVLFWLGLTLWLLGLGVWRGAGALARRVARSNVR
jgi:hypothetical protein